MTDSYKSYSELAKLSSFIDKYNYLKINSKIGIETFGTNRWINQDFYSSNDWKTFRKKIILRDKGCNLGCEDFPIVGKIYIHHINPLTIDDIRLNRLDKLLGEDNAICVDFKTHEAIHYGNELTMLDYIPIERRPGDTCPWK